MHEHRNLQIILFLGFVLSLAAVLWAQRSPKTLVVNGKPVGATVLQIDGRSYVDIETLALITRGSVRVEPSRIVLTLPESTPGATAAQSSPGQPEEGLSQGFASAAIVALGIMKEWKVALETMVTYGLAVSPAWARDHHDRAMTNLMQARVAATSPSDHQALALLNNHFASLSKWANEVATDRRELNGARTVDPDSLRTDPVLAKISDCDRVLNSMLVRGNLADGSGCQ
jgi:hypothetical protein